jgi:hypothetical protein
MVPTISSTLALFCRARFRATVGLDGLATYRAMDDREELRVMAPPGRGAVHQTERAGRLVLDLASSAGATRRNREVREPPEE